MRGLWTILLTAIVASEAAAQDWATREVCTVETPQIHEAAFAPATRAELEAGAAQIPNNIGKFWQIMSPDGAVSHLWGTFHSSDPLILNLPEIVEDKIGTARVIAVETDFIHPSRASFRDAQMMEGRFKEASDPFAFTPGDGTVAGLPEEQSDWVRDRAVELGWTEDFDLIMSLPGIAEMLLSDPCEDFTNGILPIQDDYILLLGKMAGAEILSLEDRDDLMSDLADSDDTTRAMIYTYAAYLKPSDSNTDRATSFALYLEGQLGMMEAWDYAYQQEIYGPVGLSTLGLTDQYLLDFRNHRFLDRLQGALTEGGVFVAIGAGHIPGDKGLVALLREAGYEVTRIPLPGEAP